MTPDPPQQPPLPINSYLPYRELLLNLEAAHLHRVTPAALAMTNRGPEYDQIVTRASLACTICGSTDVKFVPFTYCDLPRLHVIRVCLLCNHAEEL